MLKWSSPSNNWYEWRHGYCWFCNISSCIKSNMMACGLHLGRISKRVCVELGAPFRKISNSSDLPSNIGGIIIVDAASESQIGFDLPEGIPKCIIDHHESNSWQFSNSDLMIKMDVSATTEIIARYLINHSSTTLTEPVRKLLLAGLITDSGRFKHNKKIPLLLHMKSSVIQR